MPLTNEQIQSLFDFTRKKRVRYYDVQVEIVDHLASAIEEILEDQDYNFDLALQMAYKRFGIYGFVRIVQKKEEEMRKYWKRRIGTYMKQYFQLPKIILTIAILIVVYNLYLNFAKNYGLWWQISMGLFVLPFIIHGIKIRIMKKSLTRNFLSVQSFSAALSSILFIFIFVFQIYNNSYGVFYSYPVEVHASLFAVTWALVIIFSYGLMYHFPQMILADLQKDYPNYKISL